MFERGLGGLLLAPPLNLTLQCDEAPFHSDDDLISWNPDIAFERVQHGFGEVRVGGVGKSPNYQVVRYASDAARTFDRLLSRQFLRVGAHKASERDAALRDGDAYVSGRRLRLPIELGHHGFAQLIIDIELTTSDNYTPSLPYAPPLLQ